MNIVKNSAAVVAKIGAGQFLPFGDQSVLRGLRITGLLLAPAGAAASDGTPGYTGALKDVWLRFVNSKNLAFLEAINLTELQRAVNGGHPFPIDTTEIDWTRSGLFFGDDNARQAGVGKAITLTVLY